MATPTNYQDPCYTNKVINKCLYAIDCGWCSWANETEGACGYHVPCDGTVKLRNGTYLHHCQAGNVVTSCGEEMFTYVLAGIIYFMLGLVMIVGIIQLFRKGYWARFVKSCRTWGRNKTQYFGQKCCHDCCVDGCSQRFSHSEMEDYEQIGVEQIGDEGGSGEGGSGEGGSEDIGGDEGSSGESA